MSNTLNKQCLQEPHSQTWARDNAFYRPHVFVKGAKKDGNAENSGYEGGRALEAWMIQEERAIQTRFRKTAQNIYGGSNV